LSPNLMNLVVSKYLHGGNDAWHINQKDLSSDWWISGLTPKCSVVIICVCYDQFSFFNSAIANLMNLVVSKYLHGGNDAWHINTEFLRDDRAIFRVGVFHSLAFHCKILNIPWYFQKKGRKNGSTIFRKPDWCYVWVNDYDRWNLGFNSLNRVLMLINCWDLIYKPQVNSNSFPSWL
jgi:hypothetical protein